jgi:hypothetical protein
MARSVERRLPTTYRVRLWKGSQHFLRLKYDARNKAWLAWLVSVPVISVLAALGTNYAVAGFLKPGVLGDVLIGTATLIGGFLTTAFALSVSLQQSVVNLYSPQHLSGYAFGSVQRRSFAAIAVLILSCLSFGIYIKTLIPIEPFDWVRVLGLILAFLAIGTSFGVLGWQLQYGGEALRPGSAIIFLRDQAYRHLKVLQENAARLGVAGSLGVTERTGRFVVHGPVLSIKRQRLANAYRHLGESPGRVLLMQLAPFVDTGIRLSDRADALGAGQAISAWADVLRRYLLLRRFTSWIKPSDSVFGAMEPDNSSALHRALEQFNDLAVRVLKNRQAENARLIVHAYDAIIKSAFRIKYVNGLNENPIAETAVGYLQNLVLHSLAEGDYEVAFAAIPVFERYGIAAIEYGISHGEYTVCNYLDKIAPYAFKQSFEVLAKPCTNAWRELLWGYLFSERHSNGTHRVFESLQKYHAMSAPYYLLTNRGGVPGMPFEAVRAPFEDLQTVVEQFIGHYRNAEENRQKTLRGNFRELASTAYSFIRTSAELLTRQSGYADLVPKLMVTMARCLSELREPYSSDSGGESASNWILLLTWTGHKLRSHDQDASRTAAEFAAYATMIAVERGDDDMRDAGIKAHASIVRNQLATGKVPGYDEPRAIARMALVATYALKTRKWGLLRVLVVKIRELESDYKKRCDASAYRPATVAHEFESLGEYVDARAAMMFGDPPLGHAGRLINQNDMDHLEWFIWGQTRRYSRFESELPLRNDMGTRLVTMLANRVKEQSAKTDKA